MLSMDFAVPREQLEERAKQSNFYRLVSAYRNHGHKQANVDPISLNKPSSLPELQPKNFGLNLTDKVQFRRILFAQENEGTVEEAIRFLDTIYSDAVATEFTYLEVIFIEVNRLHFRVRCIESCCEKIMTTLNSKAKCSQSCAKRK